MPYGLHSFVFIVLDHPVLLCEEHRYVFVDHFVHEFDEMV